jgi:membrane-associated protease RseP (regulator of RpoE activity)
VTSVHPAIKTVPDAADAPEAEPAGGSASPTETTDHDVHPGWREAIEADPLGLATRREWEDGPELTPSGQRWALLRLAVIVAAIVALGFLAGAGETVILVLVLIGCIVAHEFGHYITAKAAHIKVTEFFVGFGPRLWSIRRGETEYGVKALPLGGYCRILGMNNLEEVDPADEARTYRQAPFWRRMSVALAGSTMHFIIAIVVLFGLFFWVGDNGNYLNSASQLPASNPIVAIEGLSTGASPAQEAGFKLGDRIMSVDGRTFPSWAQLSSYIQARAGQRLNVVVDRDGTLLHLYPVPVNRNDVQLSSGEGSLPSAAKGATPVGFIGVSPDSTIHSSFGLALSRAGGAWVHVSALTLGAFGHLFTLHGADSYFHMLSSQKAADNPSTGSVRLESPVGIVRLLHQAGESGLPTVFWLIAVINLSIGIFNLLPIFPLDGGHVAVAIYERARSTRRRRYHADVAKLLPIFYAGLALIVFLGASALFLDLRDLVT